DEALLKSLHHFTDSTSAVVVGDIISNVHQLPGVVRHQDVVFANQNPEQLATLQPDLLISFGKSVISKALKLYLRKHKPLAHWHLQPAGLVADTFQSLTRVIRCTPQSFFASMAGSFRTQSTFATGWFTANAKASAFLSEYTAKATYSELPVVARVLQQLPLKSNLHLANSMSVRYANIIGLQPKQQVEVYANRGTSGIDGSNSTAVGCALTKSGITTLLTGDLAFFYDRNGLWHNYLPDNLRIILMNNHAGGIFRLIDGPKQQPELAPYFETHQALDARNTARDFGLSYTCIHTLEELEKALPQFFAADAGASILEIFTDSATNAEAFEEYRKAVRSLSLV
ncbi:MAG: 2-succinyl-5-enolpyruvyl-6-hydroxy-3-cyclohexene-1-carboxylic-acid synthase, partial [Pontibacter sp.]|nr:2-succinyl-5-enolpyruvyl-6-hydroxy-3-cyclohexene-1-carboxylic-acid synthase [Pontibacter sp.]